MRGNKVVARHNIHHFPISIFQLQSYITIVSVAMNYGRLLFLAIVLSIQAGRLAFATYISCGDNGNYTSYNSMYAVNLNSTFAILSRNLSNNGFYSVSVGEGADRANALVLCRGDFQLEACRKCIGEGADELLRSCPYQKQAIRWDEQCFLRYSNATIHGTLTMEPYWSDYWDTSPDNATRPDFGASSVIGLLDRLSKEAASGGSLRKFAAGNVTGTDFVTIFEMVLCTPDLSQNDCSRCLVYARTNIGRLCDGKDGCRFAVPNCHLQLMSFPFYNETRLQELERVLSPSPPAPAPVPALGKGDGNSTRTIIIIVAPIILSLILLAVSATIWLRKRKTQKPMEIHHQTVDDISTVESLQYAFNMIKTATSDFSNDNKLGQGGFGSVYKGKLPNGREIAVKRLSMNSGQGDLEFKNEVLLLAKLQHRNLVRLLGFAIQGMEKLLIYELVQNASLDQFIFDERSPSHLDWDRRYKIIGGIARGILYLHEDSRLRIIHRDLKASNILLDGEMNPKIADFGTARLFKQDETRGSTSRVVGTYGYMPPEYIIHGQFSIKSDVFSFGVLVLEIISGRKISNFRSGENAEDLLSFAWRNWREETAANVVDPSLKSGSGLMSEMLRCIHIGLLCVQENAAERPTMASVVIMLSSSSINLALPSQPAFYFSTLNISQLDDYNSRDPQRPDQSNPLSHNDVSITDLHPR